METNPSRWEENLPGAGPGRFRSRREGGVQVLVLKRDTLAELNNLFYETNMGNDPGIAFNNLASYLWQTVSTRDERRLVFLSTVGVPFISDALGNYIEVSLMNLEKSVNWLGGTEYTVQKVLETPGTGGDPAGYALFGVPVPDDFPLSHKRVRLGTVTESDGVALPSVEASSLAAKASQGNVRGLLQRNRQGWYRPFLHDGGFSYADGQGAGRDRLQPAPPSLSGPRSLDRSRLPGPVGGLPVDQRVCLRRLDGGRGPGGSSRGL